MTRKYFFEWYPTKEAKYGKPITRTNVVFLNRCTGNTSIDAKAATDLFIKNFGNLNKNTIVKIKEFGDNGQIGEDIVPTEENAIIPIARKK